jgi:hypothetical protein
MQPLVLVKRAVLWALASSLLGVVLWAVIAGTVWLAIHPMPTLAETVRAWPLSVAGTGFWALFIGAIAAPAYSVVFSLWQLLLRRRPELDATRARRALTAAGLGTPPVVMLTVGFATTSGFPFDWREAAWVLPVSAITCWGAVYLPRRIVPSLRPPLGAAAGSGAAAG